MDRDTFSHIRLWCPRPFGTYSQNKARTPGLSSNSGGSGGAVAPSLCKAQPSPCARRAAEGSKNGMIVGVQEENGEVADVELENTPPEPDLNSSSPTPSQAPQPPSAPLSPPSSGSQVEDGRVLLDTWYVIKPGNTKEKIAFFVAHQFSGAGQPRPSAMKVKGNWATDCSKAKRRRRCSSYEPPTRSQASESHLSHDSLHAPASVEETHLGEVNETDLLSVAEMVALVEQRTAMALQGIVAVQGTHHHQPPTTTQSQSLTPHQHTVLRSTVSDPTSIVFMPESSNNQPPKEAPEVSPIHMDQELEEQHESCKVAQAIAHFESQNLENRLHLSSRSGIDSSSQDREKERTRAGESDTINPPSTPSHSHGEVRIAFRVSNLDPRSPLEPAGRSRCMFMSCGGGGSQAAARAKEKITCDLYQLVSPSSRDPSSLLLAATTATPKADGDLHHTDRQTCGSPDPSQDFSPVETKPVGVGRERVTGFHVEVVVTGAVDQCVFYGKDSTENVQEETVCFALPSGGGEWWECRKLHRPLI
uniref:F-box only protein 46-like n=1 Tax=Gouania willdenowi TaxID=441366 RepID=A0A8C5G3H1_GOUWI